MCQQIVSGVRFDSGNFIVASETATPCMKSLFYGLLETYFAVYDSVVLTGPTSGWRSARCGGRMMQACPAPRGRTCCYRRGREYVSGPGRLRSRRSCHLTHKSATWAKICVKNAKWEFMRQILVEYVGRRGQKVSSRGCTEDSTDTSGAHPGEQKTSSVGTTARLTHNLAALTHNLAQKTAPRRQRACEMSPLPFEAILCVKIDFGQRYGSPNFD